MAVLARHSARFDVLQIQFDPVTGKHLAVAGLRIVQVSDLCTTSTTQSYFVNLPCAGKLSQQAASIMCALHLRTAYMMLLLLQLQNRH